MPKHEKMRESQYGSAGIKALLLLLFICSPIVYTTSAADNILRNGDGIFLTTGQSWTFDQGYVLTVKSVNQETNEAWLELSLDGNILAEGIYREKESLAYSRDTEILNITLDTVYSSPSGELITFTPVYQYLDPQLPAPETAKGEPVQNEDQDSQLNNSSDNVYVPGFEIFPAFTAIMVCGMAVSHIQKRK